MIHVEKLQKIFSTPRRYPGFMGTLKGLVTRDRVKTVAVDDVSFEIAPGEIVGYIGANGAGKSTTIKMMTGILTPTAGTIRVDGIVPYEKRRENAGKIGVVFGQCTQLWWDLPVNESLTLLRIMTHCEVLDYAISETRIEEIVKRIYLAAESAR